MKIGNLRFCSALSSVGCLPKTHLSRLVEQGAAGKEFVTVKARKPLARLVPLALPVRTKNLGLSSVSSHASAPRCAPAALGLKRTQTHRSRRAGPNCQGRRL